ncbi:MAG: hypothetical protein IJC16_05960 [Rikenellaceae bacterium]|nr:hypothetical protein [Rikenellaceae bacterium]
MRTLPDTMTSPAVPSREALAAALLADLSSHTKERFGSMVATGGLYGLALDMAFDPDPRIAFRISWALEWAYFYDPVAFLPHVPAFLRNFGAVTNASVRRHYAKILSHLIRSGLYVPTTGEGEAIAAVCFDLLIAPAVRPAVQVWCMEILADLADSLPWVREELPATLRHRFGASPGFDVRALRILRRLDRWGVRFFLP